MLSIVQGAADDEADASDDGATLYADDLAEGLTNDTAQGDGGTPDARGQKKRKVSAGPEGAVHTAGLLPRVDAKPSRKFIASARFTGQRNGYAFMTGTEGTGFYLDVPPTKTAAASSKNAAKKGTGVGVDDGEDDDLASSKRFMKKVRSEAVQNM